MASHLSASRRRSPARSRPSRPLVEMLEDRVLLSSYYVSASAGAGGNGSSGSPWNKIQTALNTVVAGDTINVRDGTYRENLLIQSGHFGSAGNLITIQADTGAHPVITGSDAVTGWTQYSGNIWMKTGWTVNSQQVFDDGAPLQQIGRPPNPPYDPNDGTDEYPNPVGSGLGDMAPGRFYYDPTGQTLYVQLADNSNPNNSAMEVSTRMRTLFSEASRGYLHLKGLTFEHNNSSGLGQQQDALVAPGSHSIVEDCIFRYGDFAGLSLGTGSVGIQVFNCTFTNNGDMGIQAPNSQDFLIKDNIVTNNNYRHFNTQWHAGGIHVSSSSSSGVIEGNEVANNYGSGIWCDFAGGPVTITGNYIHDNGPNEAGIFFEASHHGLITNNVLVNNNRRGIYISGSDDAKVYNNTIVGQQGLSGIEVLARNGVNSTNTIVKNNIISDGTSSRDLYLSTGTGNASDYNDVYRSAGAKFIYNGSAKTLAQMQALGFELHTTTASPAFSSTSGDNYPLSSASPAKDSGTNLSPDVTSDYDGTARPQGSAYDMGAYEAAAGGGGGGGLVGLWHLDENSGTTTADASGTGNTGTLQNGVAWTTPGKQGAADLTFDGTNDNVSIADSSSLDVTTAMSLGGWFNHASSGGNGSTGVARAQNYRLTVQETNAANSHWQFWFHDSNGTIHSVTTTNAYSNDAWHYIMATYDGAQFQIYVDGVAATAPVSFSGSIQTSSSALSLGRRDGTAYYKGQMDEIRLYSRALSASEVAALASASSPDASLVGYWQLNENSGTTTADSSGNGNDGTLQNGVAWTTPGKAGAADLTFDGTDDSVAIADSNSLDVTTGVTIGGWFNHASSGGNGTTGVAKAQNYRLTAQEANAASSHWQFLISDSAGTYHSVTTSGTYSNDAWHYVMATYNGAQLQIYVDGVAAATAVSFSGTIQTSTSGLSLGRRDGIALYKGQMDEIRIYNRGLSSSEVASLYSAGGAGMLALQSPAKSSVPITVPNLLFAQPVIHPSTQSKYEQLVALM